MAAPSKIRAVYQETEASFSAGPSVADGSSMRFIHASSPAPAPDWGEVIQKDEQNDTLDDPGVIIGAPGGTFSFSVKGRGPGSANAALAGVAAQYGEVGRSLRAVFGAGSLPEGAVAAAGWTTTSGDVDDASTWSKGEMIYRTVGTAQEMRVISAVSGNTVTVFPAWSSAPAENDVFVACANAKSSDGGQQSECFLVKGYDWKHLFNGCMGNVKLSLTARGVPSFAFDYLIDNPKRDNSGITALPAATDPWPDTSPVVCSPLWLNGTQILINQLDFDLGNDRQAVLATGACPTGRSEWRIAAQKKVITLKRQFSDAMIDSFVAADNLSVFWQSKGKLGNILGLWIPKAQIVVNPNVEDQSGIDGQSVQLVAKRPDTDEPAATIAIG